MRATTENAIGLWGSARAVTARALRSGDLQPIATLQRVLEANGIEWVVHVLTHLDEKVADQNRRRDRGENPFLPYEERLFIAELSPTHLCLLNKFNVLDHHVLIVTREFVDQASPLERSDFEALWIGLAEGEALGFYNSALAAGASQSHRHFQLVPLPLGVGGRKLPVDPLLAELDLATEEIGRISAWPFAHGVMRIDDCRDISLREAAVRTLARYRVLQGALGTGCAYNLLVTDRWMIHVPRRIGSWKGIPVNALGFAGALMVRDEAQFEVLRRRTPIGLLTEVACE